MQMRPSNKAALCVVFSRGRDAQPRHESQPVLGQFSSDAPCASAHALPSSVKLLQPCREGMAAVSARSMTAHRRLRRQCFD
jgi:hypothetical protein